MYQNKDMSPECIKDTFKLDNKKRQQLSKANFRFGTYESDYRTVAKNDFEAKSPIKENSTFDLKKIGKTLRSHSYVMGETNVDYLTDNKLRFENPNVKKAPCTFFFFNFFLFKIIYIYPFIFIPFFSGPKSCESKRKASKF